MQALDARPALRETLGATPIINSAKFLAPVGPGDRLRVALHADSRGVTFEVWRGATPIARGQLSK